MKTGEGVKKRFFNKVPVLFEESRPEAIGSGAGVIIHGEEGSPNFVEGERADKGGSLRR